MPNFHSALHANTPNIIVTAPVGRIRHLQYLRIASADPPRLLTSITRAEVLSRTKHYFGPRVLANNAQDASIALTLAGQPLYQHTADGDEVLSLTDVNGRSLWHLSAQGTTKNVVYEPSRSAGRLLSCAESASGAPARIRDNYLYGPIDDSHRNLNLVGAVIRHNHNAGYTLLQSTSLSGEVIATTQVLLSVETGLPDWGMADDPQTDAPLTEIFDYDATGAVLAHVCATGIRTLTKYTVNGTVGEVGLRFREGCVEREHTTLTDVKHAADGKVLSKSSGNGIVETFTYDIRTQFLDTHTSRRQINHPAGALLIGDQHYTYDPVGNILTQHDFATATQWHRNRVTDGQRTYTYDTLHRLVSATGRERLPNVSGPQQGCNEHWFPYVERYTCDDGGNLTGIDHNGQSPWTREIVVAQGNNRALQKEHPLTPEEGFLSGGLQKRLANNRKLTWYADGQLAQVSTVVREGDAQSDIERYHYAGSGARTRKIHTVLASGNTQISVTSYAGGMETRQRRCVDKLQLDIVITDAGNARLVNNRLTGKIHLRYKLTSPFNSTSGETDDAGNITSREEYFPYGASAGSDEETCEVTDRTRRYSGKERDASGLLYYGWRYYQAESGRWLSADPGGLIDGVNLFHFCRNNPINGVDNDGKMYRSYATASVSGGDDGDGEDLDAMLARLRLGRSRTTTAASNEDLSLDEMLSRLRGPLASVTESHASEKYAADQASGELYQSLGDSAAERYRFVVKNFDHEKSVKPGGGLIKSRPRYSDNVHYNSEYTPSRWTFKSVFRHEDSTRKDYFVSDVIRYQYAFVSHRNGFTGTMPDILRHENVLNAGVLDIVKNVNEGEEIPLHDFLKKTDNGKLTQRVLSDFNMKAVTVIKVMEADKIHVDVHVTCKCEARRMRRPSY